MNDIQFRLQRIKHQLLLWRRHQVHGFQQRHAQLMPRLVPVPLSVSQLPPPRLQEVGQQAEAPASPSSAKSLWIAGYVVSEEGDVSLLGHPDIRY